MDEESDLFNFRDSTYDPITLCKCLRDSESSEHVEISPRKERILTTVARTEEYLRKRRITELILFLFTKVLAMGPVRPVIFLEKLVDDCMLFRAGVGPAPVLYEDRHLEAVVKSFDPGHRGWLSVGQIRRLYTTLGLTLRMNFDERTPCHVVLENVKKSQEEELYRLLTADSENNTEISKSDYGII